jgi:hypothetical protein
MVVKNYLDLIDKSNIKKHYIALIVILFFAMFFTQQINIVSAGTGINQQIPYSGTLVNNAGVVLPDNTYRAKFVLWDALTGGTQVYEEIRNGGVTYSGTGVSPALSINDGRFDILLGSQNTILPTIVNNDSLYLEIQLDMDNNGSYEEIFNPRRRIGSALSSINALRLVAASGGTNTNTLSLDVAGNVVATSLGGIVNSSTPSGFDRVIIANSSGQFSQVSWSSIVTNNWALAGNSTTDAWNGTSGSRLGTTSAQPLVLATTNATAQDIKFFTGVNGANERMRITGTGNVGIGTTAPTALLNVANLTASTTGTVARIQSNSTNASSGLTVLANGNVGIGTITPNGSLDVFNYNSDPGYDSGEEAITIRTNFTTPNARNGLRFTTGTRTTGLAQIDLVNGASINEGILSFGTRNSSNSITEKMRIDANGNVVIGANNPNGGSIDVVTVNSDPGYDSGEEAITMRTSFTTPNARSGLRFTTGTRTTGLAQIDLINGASINEGILSFGTRNSSNIITEKMRIDANGNVGIGTTSPTARLNLGAGTATANTSPLKFTAGTNLTTAEAGALEWDGTNLFLTTSGAVRQTINQGLTAAASLDFPSTDAGAVSNLTVTVTGAALNDVVSLGVPNGSVPLTGDFSAWVSAANTVTVRYTNNSTTTAQDPAVNTFKVFVTK